MRRDEDIPALSDALKCMSIKELEELGRIVRLSRATLVAIRLGKPRDHRISTILTLKHALLTGRVEEEGE